jgi:hypothetical protein
VRPSHPGGKVRCHNAEGIACSLIHSDSHEQSSFVRQAYFLVANDPCQELKTTLKADVN